MGVTISDIANAIANQNTVNPAGQIGGALDEHDAPGPITIHVLEGEWELVAGGARGTYATGALIALNRRVRHAVRSERGAMFLISLSASDSDTRRNDP